ILIRSPLGALRYAWLRAPPSHRRNLTRTCSRALTHNSPYEGGQSGACPPSTTTLRMDGGHGACAPLPTLRNHTATSCAAAPLARFGFFFAGSNSEHAASPAVSATPGLRDTMAATMAPSMSSAS